MRASQRWIRPAALVMVLGLVAAACGDDDDDDAGTTEPAADATDAPDATEAPPEETEASPPEATEAPATEATEMTESTEAPEGEELALEGQVEVAAGTVLDLDVCPGDWDPHEGITDNEIRIGWTGPQSGALAAFGEIAIGMQAYFDWVNATNPIGEQDLVLVTRDDGYEAGRAVANVEEMMATENIFAVAMAIGTPINVALRPITSEACVPQLFNSTGFPIWGDPANYPWTTGLILDYLTEGQIWCDAIVEEFGEGATVAGLYMNNDFGKNYETAMNDCAETGGIELVAEELHDPAAPDVTNEMTTMISSGADVFIAGTTAAFCPQTVASVAASEWRPRYYMSYTCNNLASFFTPVQEQAATLAQEGSGVRMVNSNKVCGDPAYDDDPAIQELREILREYAGVECEDGSFSTGILFGEILTETLRAAAALPGGLNRVNLMSAVWNLDLPSRYLLTGQNRMDGVNDAYLVESGQIQEVVVEDGTPTFNPVGELVDFEGEGGSWQG